MRSSTILRYQDLKVNLYLLVMVAIRLIFLRTKECDLY